VDLQEAPRLQDLNQNHSENAKSGNSEQNQMQVNNSPWLQGKKTEMRTSTMPGAK